MKDLLFGYNAIQNYVSELFGIVISILLIPVIINIYLRHKNRTKRYLGRHILIEKINIFLEDMVPEQFINQHLGYNYQKGLDHFIIPFELADNCSELPYYFEQLFCNKSISKMNSIKLTSEYIDKLKSFRNELFNILNVYGDCFSTKVIKEIYKLDYNIQSQQYIKRKDVMDVAILVEAIYTVINVSIEMRNIFMKKGNRVYFKDMVL